VKEGNRQKELWAYVRLLEEFLQVWLYFKDLYRKYRRKELTFGDIAAFVGDKDPYLPMYHLKELSHRLFRDPEGEPPEEGRLIDLAIGSIFHEAMKLRENLYQLEVYRPSYQRIRTEELSPYQERLHREFSKIGRRAERALREGMAEARRLFQNTLEQIRAFMAARGKGNPLLVRFLLKSEGLLRRAYGRRGFDSLMAEIFPGGVASALREGALSLMEGMHFGEAEKLWERYLRFNPDDLEARFLRLYCRGYDAYLQNRYGVALTAWRKALRFAEAMGVSNAKGYLERMAELTARMGRELQEEDKEGQARVAFRLSERLRLKSMQGGKDADLRV